MPVQPPENLTVATTGASGSLFLKHFLCTVERDKRVKLVNFIASDSGLRVIAEELGLKGRTNLVTQILGKPSRKIREQANADIGANVASGSYPADAMVVVPCSVGTLSRIANGDASHLIERAADVTLKEKRPLVLCVRETPLNKIHIRNMWRAADAGATLFPLIPTFYNLPPNLDAMAREFANRLLVILAFLRWAPINGRVERSILRGNPSARVTISIGGLGLPGQMPRGHGPRSLKLKNCLRAVVVNVHSVVHIYVRYRAILHLNVLTAASLWPMLDRVLSQS